MCFNRCTLYKDFLPYIKLHSVKVQNNTWVQKTNRRCHYPTPCSLGGNNLVTCTLWFTEVIENQLKHNGQSPEKLLWKCLNSCWFQGQSRQQTRTAVLLPLCFFSVTFKNKDVMKAISLAQYNKKILWIFTWLSVLIIETTSVYQAETLYISSIQGNFASMDFRAGYTSSW